MRRSGFASVPISWRIRQLCLRKRLESVDVTETVADAVGRRGNDGGNHFLCPLYRWSVRARHAACSVVGLGSRPCRRNSALADGAPARRFRRSRARTAGPAHVGAGDRARGALHPRCPPSRADRARLPGHQGHAAQGLCHRAGSLERRHYRLRRRPVLGPARLGEAPRGTADHPQRRGEGLPGWSNGRTLPDVERLGDPAR